MVKKPKLKAGKQMFNNKLLARLVEYTIPASGSTGHCLSKVAPVMNLKVNKNPIQIRLPNKKKHTYSTHTYNLNIPWYPHYTTETHIVLGLSHSSLISTRKFYNAGCKVTFDEDEHWVQ